MPLIEGISANNLFSHLNSVRQSTSSNCGLYVLMNALLITYICRKAPANHSILLNPDIYAKLERAVLDLYYDYYMALESKENKDRYAAYFLGPNGKIPDFSQPKDVVVTQIREISIVPNLENYDRIITIQPSRGVTHAAIILNIKDLFRHIIVVESAFDKDCLCNNIFTNNANLSKMKEFYDSADATISFIIGNNGHWKLYTINKATSSQVTGPQYQTFYLDSFGTGASASMVSGLNSKILKYTTFDDFKEGILDCIRAESDINISNSDNLDFLLNYDAAKFGAIPATTQESIIQKFISFDTSKRTDQSYLQSYERMTRNLAASNWREKLFADVGKSNGRYPNNQFMRVKTIIESLVPSKSTNIAEIYSDILRNLEKLASGIMGGNSKDTGRHNSCLPQFSINKRQNIGVNNRYGGGKFKSPLVSFILT